jgi:Zn-dependent protease
LFPSLDQIVQNALVVFPILLLSLTVHEFAHAWSARRLGDDTAERAGRYSLNPLVHADPIGSVLLPILGVPFGWAKPVPVNPARFRRTVRMGTGMMWTALAGPLANMALAVATTVAFALTVRFSPGSFDGQAFLLPLFQTTIGMNIGLAVFNLLPIPPLDGSRVVEAFLPTRLRPQWEALSRYGFFLLLALVFVGRPMLDLVMRPFGAMLNSIFRALV